MSRCFFIFISKMSTRKFVPIRKHQNEFDFYASSRFLTISFLKISFLIQKHPSQPQSVLPLLTRSGCIFKNSLKRIVNAVHNFWGFCERRSMCGGWGDVGIIVSLLSFARSCIIMLSDVFDRLILSALIGETESEVIITIFIIR